MGKSALSDIYHFDTLGQRDLPVCIWHINLWSGDIYVQFKALKSLKIPKTLIQKKHSYLV